QLVRLSYTVNSGKIGLLPAGNGGKRDRIVEGPVTWPMASLKVKPGDTIRYHAEALDWDNLNGPHVGKSNELQIRILDRGQLEQMFEDKRKELLEALRQLIKAQKEAQAAVDAQRSAPRPNADRIAESEHQQRGLAQQAAEVQRRIGELNRMAQMNNLASAETMRAQQAAEQAMADIAKNAMPRAANQIAQAQPQAQANPQQ